MMSNFTLQISSRLLAEAAMQRGWDVEYLDERYTSIVMITPPGRKGKLFKSSVTERESYLGGYISANKYLSYRILQKHDYPVPKTWLADDATFTPENAKKYVVKPATANHGDGVFVNLDTKDAIISAVQKATAYDNKGDVVIQEQLGGYDHRFLVVGNEVFVVKRSPPVVMGDGVSTLTELVTRLNQDPRRGEAREGILNRVLFDDVEAYLGKARLSSIPAFGEEVVLLGTANVGRGGSTENVTAKTHPSLIHLALEVARLLSVEVCGIDIMCEDSALAVDDQVCGIIEINLSPGIRMHHRPSIGEPVSVADKILDLNFKEQETI